MSYIKESESRQKNVEQIFNRLSHLIIQASSEMTVDFEKDRMSLVYMD